MKHLLDPRAFARRRTGGDRRDRTDQQQMSRQLIKEHEPMELPATRMSAVRRRS